MITSIPKGITRFELLHDLMELLIALSSYYFNRRIKLHYVIFNLMISKDKQWTYAVVQFI